MLKLVLLPIHTFKNFLAWNRKGKKLFPFQEVPFNTHTCRSDPLTNISAKNRFPNAQTSFKASFIV
jgi:hypothetical protein